MKHSRRYQSAATLVDPRDTYGIDEAVEKVKAGATAGFDETVEAVIILGIKPSQVVVRGACNLPHGTGQTVSILAFAKGESIKDTVAVLSRMGHGIGIRLLVDPVHRMGEATEIAYEFAKWASVPVINMMTDYWHPCQAITDIMTVIEKLGDVRGKKITVTWAYSPWARDWGSITSTTMIYARYGMDVTLAYPEGYDMIPEAVELAKKYAEESEGSFRIVNDIDEGLEGADVVFPRNWITMRRYDIGKEEEIRLAGQHKDWKFTRERREKLTNKAHLLHVMPIDRGNEADSDLVDDPEVSWLYDQAENRLHSQKAILALTMGGRL